MFASVRALLAGVIDYAGLFPPAKLPLDQAIRNYARYRQEPEGWMLGRFVCPATRLAELGPYREELFDSGPPFEFSVLGRGGDSPDQFLAGFRADLQAVTSFQEYHADRVQVDAIEVRLPPDVVRLENFDPATELLASAADILDSWGGALTPYYEPPLGSNWRQELNAAQGVVLCGHIQDEIKGRLPRRSAGLKLRCGGLEVSAFPPPELVADAITSCRDLGMNLKFTAGLHHPIRRYDAAVNTKMHGFFNVFGAGVLAHARRLIEKQVRQIIADEDPANFVFDDEGFRWKDFRASTEEIRAARQGSLVPFGTGGVTSFGSCSFDEPRDDLRALGLLGQGGSPRREIP